MSINKFIKEAIQEASYYKDGDIKDYLIVLKQNIEDSKFEEFLSDIENKTYDILIRTEYNPLLEGDNEEIIGINVWLDDEDYFYIIRFIDIEDNLGYCQCSKEDKYYDGRYDCCGIECDWTRPGVNISKVTPMGSMKFRGLERELWKARDEFEGKTTEDILRESKEKEIQRTQEQINELYAYLKHLKGEN